MNIAIELKKLMYETDVPQDVRFKLNDLIFSYDEDRASSEEEVMNAGKEWNYRLKKVCDFMAKDI